MILLLRVLHMTSPLASYPELRALVPNHPNPTLSSRDIMMSWSMGLSLICWRHFRTLTVAHVSEITIDKYFSEAPLLLPDELIYQQDSYKYTEL